MCQKDFPAAKHNANISTVFMGICNERVNHVVMNMETASGEMSLQLKVYPATALHTNLSSIFSRLAVISMSPSM